MTRKKGSSSPQKIAAVIPAAGSGIRMGGKQAKQYLDLNGRPLLAVTLQAFQHCPPVDAIILVVPPTDVGFCREKIVDQFGLDKVKKVVPGGERRQDSVRLGIGAIDEEYGLVVIHDGVRPVIDQGFIERIVATANSHRAVIAGLPARETVKEINNLREVVRTYDRLQVWLVQTPQVFRYEDILAAHQKAFQEGWDEATDDSSLIEKMGIPVKVVEGSEKNIKVTTPSDLELARFLLKCP